MFLIGKRLTKCVKAVNTYHFVLDSVPDQYESKDTCDKAVDNNASASEFLPD